MISTRWQIIFCGILALILPRIEGNAISLDSSNFNDTISKNQVVLLNFYADWCRFSQMLSPIWDELATIVSKKFPEPGKAIIAKVDCEQQQEIASRYHITKYPTLKLLCNGQLVKKEYRGPRTAESMATFVEEQLKDPIIKIESLDDIKKAKEENKRTIFGYFDASGHSAQYQNLQKISQALKDDCKFVVGIGDIVKQLRPPGSAVVTFSGSASDEDDTFLGDLNTYAELLVWATDRCIPLVREITFGNAEELTEEGLPFLILFHDPVDDDSPKQYRAVIERELVDHKTKVNFLIADGIQFAHPLHHLGKSRSDLPLIAIDSFRHMYLFKDYSRINDAGVLRAFLDDLYSGKLHKEFHYGPTDEEQLSATIQQIAGERAGGEAVRRVTTPPESTFKKLGPSPNRYTLLQKEEL
uniref:Endoplasmic reticulum resident protein 44-like n=1 Tax=Hirondellea gigas TaxID=1518452 RepID=A0A6A7FVD2_9CRUS